MLFLVNDETIMKKSSHNKERLNLDDEARFADAQTFVDTFINKGQLAKQKDANTYNEYVDIRTEEENKEIERIYTKYNKNIMRKEVSTNVAYLSAIVIPIIGCIIYGILAFCNVF